MLVVMSQLITFSSIDSPQRPRGDNFLPRAFSQEAPKPGKSTGSYIIRAICIFIKVCIGKEINPKKLPLNYNKNRLPEFQHHFLCVLCDFLTDLERFSVV